MLTERFADLMEMKEAVNTWSKNIAKLKEFAAEFGHLPKNRDTYDDFAIGYTLANMKVRARKGRLNETQMQDLIDLGCIHGEKRSDDQKPKVDVFLR